LALKQLWMYGFKMMLEDHDKDTFIINIYISLMIHSQIKWL
jgi:hypothetical protein